MTIRNRSIYFATGDIFTFDNDGVCRRQPPSLNSRLNGINRWFSEWNKLLDKGNS